MNPTPLKRLFLGAIALVVLLMLSSSLLGSLGEPQITSRLQLYQTDLLLHATELNSGDLAESRNAVLGADPLGEALKQYQEVRQTAATNLQQFQKRLQQPAVSENPSTLPETGATRRSNPQQQIQTAIRQQRELLYQLDLRIGILQAQQNQLGAAVGTWKAIDPAAPQPVLSAAAVLSGLWSDPPRLLPDAEPTLQKSLDGWFRYKALARLYELQQRSDVLATLQAAEQQVAQQTLIKLALVGTLPVFAGVAGLVLLLVLGGRWLLRKPSPLTENEPWSVPWDWETIAQVLLVGFFLMGQIVIPVLVQALGTEFVAALGTRARAAYTLTYYLLMASSGLAVLYFSIRPYFPLPPDWFRLTGKRSWVLWGAGGYLVALPLMLMTSVINQQIWQGQGGSNPLLQIVLEEGDPVALLLFFLTAAIAAPVFEELLFRGFLLTSLTRYMPVWGAIALSSLIFATAHLSFSEILPLSVLGSVLGFVYTRSRGLLAPMLLHSLWNSVTMIGLFLLGSGVKG
ncbi:CPBP family intramembrane metalloprotease [Phormidium tenue FACHB-886]|nr:CPBP family intramembrane metalloprotease [Phormidium tenue FACHB-886]